MEDLSYFYKHFLRYKLKPRKLTMSQQNFWKLNPINQLLCMDLANSKVKES